MRIFKPPPPGLYRVHPQESVHTITRRHGIMWIRQSKLSNAQRMLEVQINYPCQEVQKESKRGNGTESPMLKGPVRSRRRWRGQTQPGNYDPTNDSSRSNARPEDKTMRVQWHIHKEWPSKIQWMKSSQVRLSRTHAVLTATCHTRMVTNGNRLTPEN